MSQAQSEAERVGGKTHYFGASASCRVRFPRASADTDGRINWGDELPIDFDRAARGCKCRPVFDDDLNRWVLQTESLLTFFHADDRRPAWMRRAMRLTGDRNPELLPRPAKRYAAKLLSTYGPGTVTVVNANRPITGLVVAGSPGRKGDFFPAHSYFDQHLMVKLVGKTFVAKEPIRVSALITQWPPKGEVYRSVKATEFYDTANLDGPPAFQFGKCRVETIDSLPASTLRTYQATIETLRASGVDVIG